MTGPVSCHSVLSIVFGQFSTVHNVEKGLSDGVVWGGGGQISRRGLTIYLLWDDHTLEKILICFHVPKKKESGIIRKISDNGGREEGGEREGD